jgi:major vault protein
MVKETRKAYVLTDKSALLIAAIKDFTDVYGIKRKAGEEWLVDKSISDIHIIDAQEKLIKV